MRRHVVSFRNVIFGAIACTSLAGFATRAFSAEYFLSVQDGRAGLADGVPVVRQAPDSLAVIELAEGRLKVVQQIDVPTSLVGPPTSVAIAPGGKLALVSAATRRDTADPGKVVPYDLVSVVLLDPEGTSAPRVSSSVRTGGGASGISINRSGTLALVANRAEGSVSILTIHGEAVEAVGKLALGGKSGPAHVAFTPDGRHALVTRGGDDRVSWLDVDGTAVKAGEDVFAGLHPYGLDVSSNGAWAVVTNLGGGRGDADTISLIDIRAKSPRVVDTVSVGQTPEAAFFLPDDRTIGVSVIDGSNKPAASPVHGVARYRQFRIADGRLTPDAEMAGGEWLQGFATSADGGEVLLQDAKNRLVKLYRRTASELVDSGEKLEFEGAPCAIKRWR